MSGFCPGRIRRREEQWRHFAVGDSCSVISVVFLGRTTTRLDQSEKRLCEYARTSYCPASNRVNSKWPFTSVCAAWGLRPSDVWMVTLAFATGLPRSSSTLPERVPRPLENWAFVANASIAIRPRIEAIRLIVHPGTIYDDFIRRRGRCPDAEGQLFLIRDCS